MRVTLLLSRHFYQPLNDHGHDGFGINSSEYLGLAVITGTDHQNKLMFAIGQRSVQFLRPRLQKIPFLAGRMADLAADADIENKRVERIDQRRGKEICRGLLVSATRDTSMDLPDRLAKI